MISAAPTVVALEGDSAWIVIIAVSLVTLPAVLLLRRVIDRPGGLASGLLLSLPLAIPLVAAFAYDHAMAPVIGILRPADPGLFREPGSLVHLLWMQAEGSFIPYTLSETAGAWMLWVGISVSSFMLLRRAFGRVLVHRLIRRCRALDASEARVEATVRELSASLQLERVPEVLVLPDGCSGAFAVGAKRARVLISTDLIDGLETGELRGIVAHELAHIEAHDIGLTFTAGVLRDLVAWNPVAHLSYKKLMADREVEADRRAASLIGDPLAVASGLVKVCEMRRHLPRRRKRLALAFLGGGRIKQRVSSLLALADGRTYGRTAANAPYILAAFLVAALGLHTGARIAAQGDDAFLIRWGSETAGERFWVPDERKAHPRREAKPAGPKAQKKARALERIREAEGLRRRDMPAYVIEMQKKWRKSGLTHEIRQWQLEAPVFEGVFQIYRMRIVLGAT